METQNLRLNVDPQDPEDHPRRVLRVKDELWAWGGGTGKIVINGSNVVSHWVGNDEDDDDVRAVAVSDDGTVVAVGFESGYTTFYTYTSSEINASNNKHPFGIVRPTPQQTHTGPSFSAQVRDIQFYPGSAKLLVVATEEGMCALRLNLDNATGVATAVDRFLEDLTAQHHDRSGIRGVAFTPDGTTMVSLSMDGRLCWWDTSNNTDPAQWLLQLRERGRCVTKKDVGELLDADAWDRSCRPHFVSNKLLALPGETFLQLRHFTKNPAVVEEFDQALLTGHVESVVALTSLDSNYLISTGRDKRVVLWSLHEGDGGAIKAEFVRQLMELKSAATDALWEDKCLLLACADGTLVTFTDEIIPCLDDTAKVENTTATTVKSSKKDNEDSPQESTKTLQTKVTDPDDTSVDVPYVDSKPTKLDCIPVNTENPQSAKKDTPSKVQAKNTIVSSIVHSDDDDDDDSEIGLNSPTPKKYPFVDDEALDDDEYHDTLPPNRKHTNNPSARSESTLASRSPTDDYVDLSLDEIDDLDLPAQTGYSGHEVYQSVELPEVQPPFAPSSSPLDLPRRYMCWNHIGSITLHRDEFGARNTVDINFADKAFRRPIGFTDNLGFILGSLGEDGGIFATDVVDEDDDADEVDDHENEALGFSEQTKLAVKRSRRNKDPNKPTGSNLYFHRYETFANIREKDWYLTLPSGERALGCATGEGWAAVMTSRRFLRLFTSGGNQGKLFWLKGTPLTMAGRSRFLAVFFHEGEPFRDGTQQIGYLLIDAVNACVVTKGSASSISTGATLTWIGFDNDCSLLTMDSAGMLSMLVCTGTGNSWEWIPILDTLGLRKSSDDGFWPVTVYDGKLVCVPLKGSKKYPDASRRPVTSALGLRLPLARGTLTKSIALEELSVRAGIALSQKRVVQELCSDDAEDEAFEKEYLALSAQVDKVTLKMFASIVEGGKLERALDLVDNLHLEKSFDLAMLIADNHRKLVDLIEERKDAKFGDIEFIKDEDSVDDVFTEQVGGSQISPDSAKSKRPVDAISEEARKVRQKPALTR